MTALVEAMRQVGEDLPLYVVSEFAPPSGHWIPYHPLRSAADNRARIGRQLATLDVRLAGIYLDPNTPYWPLRRLAWRLTSWRSWVLFSTDLNHYMLRPRSFPALAKFACWRAREVMRSQCVYCRVWRLRI